jgi:uncharacterized membrane protein YfcA
MISPAEMCGLSLSGAAAGAINAVAGGGTLVTFPTLLFFGTPPVVANATSTMALVIGTAGSVYGYREHLDPVTAWLWRFLPASLLGGLIGGLLLINTSNKTFSHLVPFLILFATVLFLAQAPLRRLLSPDRQEKRLPRPHSLWAAMVFQFAVAVYGGYFGAGIGILMLASLGFIGLSDIHQMNTVKTVLGSLINFVAAILFFGVGLIDWSRAGIMTAGALAGYFLGSHYSQRISQNRVRQIITAIGFVLSGVTFYKEFLR